MPKQALVKPIPVATPANDHRPAPYLVASDGKSVGELLPHTDLNFPDATFYGQISEELLQRKITVGHSPRGLDTRPGKWKNLELQVGQLIAKLARHEVGEKGGLSFLQGATIEGQRTAQAMKSLDLLMLDLDTGEDMNVIRRRLMDLGLFGVIYSTHSHMKPVSEVKKDEFLKWSGKAEPTAPLVSQYFREQRRYQPWVLEEPLLLPSKHTAKGVQVVLQHKPMPKFRVVLVLARQFVIADRNASQNEAIREWNERYAGAAALLGATYDRSCIDPSRLMFMPRHSKGIHAVSTAGRVLSLSRRCRLACSWASAL